jgi:peptidoglycan/xylan/chitin deacetylase (PgdA/CDA1 family)
MKYFLILTFFLNLAFCSFGQNGKIVSKTTVNISKTDIWDIISQNDSLKPLYEYANNLSYSEIVYKSDSIHVKGLLISPVAKGDYPVIIFNRGGNRGYNELILKMLFFTAAAIANEGYIILASNYRAKDEFGGKDLNDVLYLIDVAEQIENADTSKIGMFGWSRGGIMTYLALKETSRIKTAVIGNSPSNLFHSIAFRPELEENPLSQCIPNYWNNKEIELRKRSALYWADSLCKKSSILLLCGTLDAQVDYNESVLMAAKLKELNYDYELKIVETNHGFAGKRDELNRVLISWFNTRLKNVTTEQKKKISITIDDVPNTRKFQAENYHSTLLTVLDSINIPVAIFVNEGLIYNTDSISKNLELLENWIKRSYVTVGNHTYSHARYSDVGFEQFKLDIQNGEKKIKAIASKYAKTVDYFRFPYNDLGVDSLQQTKMDSLLKTLNYQNTPFTIESADWMFNSLYEYYLANGELEKATEIGKLYVSKTIDFVHFMDSVSHVNYKRNINQIYLCHDNSINADYLKDIISTLKKEGYEFVTLENALEDPVYSQKNYYYKKWGISWIYRWMSDASERKELIKLEPELNYIEQLNQELIK